MTQQTFTTAKAPGYEFIVTRDPGAPKFWQVNEASSLGFVCHGNTRAEAKSNTDKYLSRVGFERFEMAVGFALHKLGIKLT